MGHCSQEDLLRPKRIPPLRFVFRLMLVTHHHLFGFHLSLVLFLAHVKEVKSTKNLTAAFSGLNNSLKESDPMMNESNGSFAGVDGGEEKV